MIRDSALLSALKSLQNVDHVQLEHPLNPTPEETPKFIFRNPVNDQILFHAQELQTSYKNQRRSFHFRLLSPVLKEPILNIYRRKIQRFSLGNEHLIVKTPFNRDYGFIDQMSWWTCGFKLDIKDLNGKTRLRLQCQENPLSCFGSFRNFVILDEQNEEIGIIQRENSSELSNNYDVKFPANLDVNLKALILATVLLVVRRER